MEVENKADEESRRLSEEVNQLREFARSIDEAKAIIGQKVAEVDRLNDENEVLRRKIQQNDEVRQENERDIERAQSEGVRLHA